MNDVIARWDGFLAKIKDRFAQIMDESRQGCAALLQHTGGDPTAMSNAWTGMRSRALDLQAKIDDTFSAQVEPAFEDADAPGAITDRERDKGRALRHWMERECERTEVEIFAAAGRELLGRGRAEQGDGFSCTQCGGRLPLPESFQAVDVKCPYCGTLVTYEPGSRLRLAAGFTHYLARAETWDGWIAWQDAERRLHDQREPRIEHFKALERAQVEYWRAYLAAQARWLPDRLPALEADLRGKMRQWYDSVHHEKAWIAAGRPREIPFA
jgi:hypothetical protein